MKKLAHVLLSLLLVQALSAQATRFVIIAVIDGARYSETFGDPAHQYIPRIWSTLRPLG
jgi:arabinogalactan endo-1,4-beta-galactosidase